jgi:hypothetical protein
MMAHREGSDYLGRQASDTPSASPDVPQRAGGSGYYPTHHLYISHSSSTDSLLEEEEDEGALAFALDSPATPFADEDGIDLTAVSAGDPLQLTTPPPPPSLDFNKPAPVQVQRRPSRSQTVSVVTNLNSNHHLIKRKPLSPSASILGLGIRYSPNTSIATTLDQRPSRSQSLDTPDRSFRDPGTLISTNPTPCTRTVATEG